MGLTPRSILAKMRGDREMLTKEPVFQPLLIYIVVPR